MSDAGRLSFDFILNLAISDDAIGQHLCPSLTGPRILISFPVFLVAWITAMNVCKATKLRFQLCVISQVRIFSEL